MRAWRDNPPQRGYRRPNPPTHTTTDTATPRRPRAGAQVSMLLTSRSSVSMWVNLWVCLFWLLFPVRCRDAERSHPASVSSSSCTARHPGPARRRPPGNRRQRQQAEEERLQEVLLQEVKFAWLNISARPRYRLQRRSDGRQNHISTDLISRRDAGGRVDASSRPISFNEHKGPSRKLETQI